MKKFYLSLIVSLTTLLTCAQSVDFTKDGSLYYLVSPNGRFYAGSIEGTAAFFFDADTKQKRVFIAEENFGYRVSAVTNDGMLVGSMEDKAAFCKLGGEWTRIELPEGLNEAELGVNTITAANADGKVLALAFSTEPKNNYIYTETAEGKYKMEVLPIPEKDPVYGMKPQWVMVRDIAADGSMIAGMFLADDGQRQLPLIWTKSAEGWEYKFIAYNKILKEGAKLDPYPYDFQDENGDFPGTVWDDWMAARDAAESGYYYFMNGSSMSGNGKYITLNVAVQEQGEPLATMYGGVIDVEADSVCLFLGKEDAACLSVTNEGLVTLGTPSKEYFRWAFVSSVKEPAKIVTLNEWTAEKSRGKVDLSKYMTYKYNQEGMTSVADGTAYFSKEGNAFVTYQNNFIETGEWECFMVRFDQPVDVENVEGETVGIYPNPSNGVIFFSDGVENVIVYDVVGRKVFEQAEIAESADLSALGAGQYFVKAEVNGSQIVEMIILK